MSFHDAGGAVQPFEAPASSLEVALDEVEHHRELAEDEHFVFHVQEPREDSVQELHFVRLLD